MRWKYEATILHSDIYWYYQCDRIRTDKFAHIGDKKAQWIEWMGRWDWFLWYDDDDGGSNSTYTDSTTECSGERHT